jgi:nucleoside-diphosphate-sugar epimerase
MTAGRPEHPVTTARLPRAAVVLGATGFLGRHVSGTLRGAGIHVVGVSRSSDVRLDLCEADHQDLTRLLETTEADVVVNASGIVWQGDEPGMRRLNTDFVRRLARAAADVPRRPLLIQLGTVHEYGAAPEGAATGEDAAGAPPTVYGRTKRDAAEALLAAAGSGGAPAAILRIVNVCGPGTPPESLLGMVAARLRAIAGSPAHAPAVLRLSPLDARRDYVDVRDVADAVLAAAVRRQAAAGGRIFNIGRGEAVSVRHLVHTLIELSGATVRVEEAAGSTQLRTTSQWQRSDISRARTELEWLPRRALKESLGDLLAAH